MSFQQDELCELLHRWNCNIWLNQHFSRRYQHISPVIHDLGKEGKASCPSSVVRVSTPRCTFSSFLRHRCTKRRRPSLRRRAGFALLQVRHFVAAYQRAYIYIYIYIIHIYIYDLSWSSLNSFSRGSCICRDSDRFPEPLLGTSSRTVCARGHQQLHRGARHLLRGHQGEAIGIRGRVYTCFHLLKKGNRSLLDICRFFQGAQANGSMGSRSASPRSKFHHSGMVPAITA